MLGRMFDVRLLFQALLTAIIAIMSTTTLPSGTLMFKSLMGFVTKVINSA